MNKLIVTLISILISGSAMAEHVYVILDGKGTGRASLEWIIGREDPVGPQNTAEVALKNAKKNLTEGLIKKCAQDYKGVQAINICITDSSVEENDTEGDGIISVGGMFFYANVEGKMYCRTDRKNLGILDNTWFGNETGWENFSGCQERMQNQ